VIEERMVAQPFGPAAAFVLTDDQVDALGGGKRAAVRVTVADRSARLRLAVMGGENVVGLSKAARADLRIEIGDEVEVRIDLDSAPRQVDVPAELAAAWADRPDVVAAFQKLSYTHQREYAEWVGSAKQQGTRDRRSAQAVEMLAEGRKLK
jgi:Bacteriocin-protection, YdeI or OmpD-Associated/Domain of unknown function (DUF1905)